MSCLLHPSPKPSRVFPVGENMSDTASLLLCAACVKGRLQKKCFIYTLYNHNEAIYLLTVNQDIFSAVETHELCANYCNI